MSCCNKKISNLYKGEFMPVFKNESRKKNVKSKIDKGSDDKEKLDAWEKVLTTNPLKSYYLGRKEINDEQRKNRFALVHSFLPYTEKTDSWSPFLKNKAEDLFSQWDVLSSSLVGLEDVKNIKREGGRDEFRKYMFRSVGFVLDVPVQNIIGTYPHDVAFPNHAGKEGNGPGGEMRTLEDRWKLSDAILGRIELSNAEEPLTQGGYHELDYPDKLWGRTKELLYKPYATPHNEILLIGRRDVLFHEGLKPTEPVKVRAVLYFDNGGNDKNNQMARDYAPKVADLNHVGLYTMRV